MSRVLLTGAAGRIGSTLRVTLPELGHDVRCFDLLPVPGGDSGHDPGGIVGDVGSAADLDAALGGIDAIVHLAGIPGERPWPVLRATNVVGLVSVFEAARRAGVRRVVFASSIHASGFTPVADGLPIGGPPRPDTLYGVTKVFGEALGRYYADRYGLAVACIRIGTFAAQPHDEPSLATWLSPTDCARLVDACLRAPDLGYALVWGVSANTRGRADPAPGRALGYVAQDDSETYAPGLPAIAPDPSDELLGGGFTTAGFGIDEVAARA